jgi:transcriptional regulator with XRE-family HTH domain
MTPSDREAAGQRIARARKRRGLSQAVLAGLVGRSESWLSQVERGKRGVDGQLWLARDTYAAETAWAPRHTGKELRLSRLGAFDAALAAIRADTVAAEHALLHALPRLSAALVHADPQPSQGTDYHATLAPHR